MRAGSNDDKNSVEFDIYLRRENCAASKVLWIIICCDGASSIIDAPVNKSSMEELLAIAFDAAGNKI